MPNMLTLFTNIEQITLNNLRLHCHAVLLERTPHRVSLRGFGHTPSLPVFDHTLTAGIAYEHQEISPPPIYTSDAAGGKTAIFRAGKIKLGSTQLDYVTCDPKYPLDVFELEDTDGHGVPTIWQELVTRAERYWTAPLIPMLVIRPTRQEQERRDQQYAQGIAGSNPPLRSRSE